MSDCRYCGEPAGFLRHQHTECEAAHTSAIAAIADAIRFSLAHPETLPSLPANIQEKATTGFVSKTEEQLLLVGAWRHSLDQIIESGVLDEARESQLIEFMKVCHLSRDDLNATHSFDRLVKASTLRDVMHGTIPQKFTLTGNLPVNFQKGEQLVWAFPNTRYLEDKTRHVTVGHSGGTSMRVAKGLYFHSNSFRSESVETTERRCVDVGWFIVTSKNVYFAGPQKSLRIPYPKIVSFQAYSNGLGLMRDAASAKPQTFVTGDGWFTYNLVANVAKI